MISPWAALLLLATITLGLPQHVQCKTGVPLLMIKKYIFL